MNLIKKYFVFIKYNIVGTICTILNITFYFIVFNAIKIKLINNIIAYILTIIVSFILNKKYVFKNSEDNKKIVFKQFTTFVLLRLTSLAIDSIAFMVCINCFHLSDLLGKIISNACTTFNNYFFNKLIIFKKV